jgi:hypothetical protein
MKKLILMIAVAIGVVALSGLNVEIKANTAYAEPNDNGGGDGR